MKNKLTNGNVADQTGTSNGKADRKTRLILTTLIVVDGKPNGSKAWGLESFLDGFGTFFFSQVARTRDNAPPAAVEVSLDELHNTPAFNALITLRLGEEQEQRSQSGDKQYSGLQRQWAYACVLGDDDR